MVVSVTEAISASRLPFCDGRSPGTLVCCPISRERNLGSTINFALPSFHAKQSDWRRRVLPVFLCPSTARNRSANLTGAWKACAFTDYGGLYGVEGSTAIEPTLDAASSSLVDDSLGVLLYDEPVAPKQITDGLGKTAAVAESIRSSRHRNGMDQRAKYLCPGPFHADQFGRRRSAANAGNEIGSPHPGGASWRFAMPTSSSSPIRSIRKCSTPC